MSEYHSDIGNPFSNLCPTLAFEMVMSKLYASIGKPTDLKSPAIAANIRSYDETNKEKSIKGVEAAVGPQGFMLFWSITMLSQSTKSLDAGLFVPVEILVRQLSDEEGTEIMWQVPSTLIAALNRGYNELLNAAHVLDRKLEGLIAFIGRDV
ncbi:uncharacterized protein EAF01_003005 [Botrytis porri]|uniref:uncharacterized protein n=1 Tax=Botrytis porri TaxID=87229 RepID=UPI0018FFC9E5|nr:uncharacterized protein EAF01_003005 [Botrytis porri]KAF7909287.1 hypothetical protein EAF01_003005 [Botrytis porri]